MSKRKFTIVSQDESPWSANAKVDWTFCFICQCQDRLSGIVSPFKSSMFQKNQEELILFYIGKPDGFLCNK